MIVTITGASGAGKTSIVRELLRRDDLSLIISYTTTARRESDLQGEYQYCTPQEFTKLKTAGDFIWTVSLHGGEYGTTRRSLEKALNDEDGIYIIIIIRDVWEILSGLAQDIGKPNEILPFYITSPPPEILQNRLRNRGDSEEAIALRLAECASWDSQAIKAKIPYIFIDNDRHARDAAEEIGYQIDQYFVGM